jgi:hypothetical protein
MKTFYTLLIGIMLVFTACEEINNIITDPALTDSEIIEGLKTALKVGTDSSSTTLSKLNGYYGDALVKIPLPPEAENVRNLINNNAALATISTAVGLDGAFENVILAVNRAAENAANGAAPIFKDAITNLTISQGLNILHGIVPDNSGTKSADFDSTAAAQYLKMQTYTSLTNLYAPQINTALDVDVIGNTSAVETWTSLTSTYNNFLSRTDVTTAISIANLGGANINLPSSINTNLGAFCTQKALDGLVYKVGVEEKKIRKNPLEWAATAVGNILKRVFGSGQ